MSRYTLARGTACLRCRKLHVKCTGWRPTCSRCLRARNQCFYSEETQHALPLGPVVRPPLDLELRSNKVLLSSKHNLFVISARLQERINRLGRLREALPTLSSIPMLICDERAQLDAISSKSFCHVGLPTRYPQEGEIHGVETSIMEHTLESFQWAKGEELPLPMSLYLIGIFLPYRSHFNFFIPLTHLLRVLPLPTWHAESLHPCLRNALHLAACSILGGDWKLMEPYFADRTRHFLERALMLVNQRHIMDYLWASCLLATYFARERRLEESYTIIAPASYFAIACGLVCTHNPEYEDHYDPHDYLLPAPVTETEVLLRLWLAHSVFTTDQMLSTLTGLPSCVSCDSRWTPSMEKVEVVYPWFKTPVAREEEVSKVWQSDIHRNLSIAHVFRQVTATLLPMFQNPTIIEVALKPLIYFHDSRIPPLSDAISYSDSDLLLAHTTLYGSAAVLQSLLAANDPKAKSEMLRCAQRLVEICKIVQGHEHFRSLQPSVVSMIHMMNAIRIFTHELQGQKVQENLAVCNEYCHSIELLLDFLGAMAALYPAWSNSPDLLKDTLIATMGTLRT
ncbi:hypothetical protein DL93DRAFT_859284 [Clavulina sp. PMI_390]|nr:hypothetical protein DL93DRAFT_859284 [Clavulina sp. PMI_390]